MTRNLLKISAVACGMLLTGSAFAAGHGGMAGPSGAMLANTCAGCHGTNGVSAGAAPSLKGLPADYLATAMKDFKSGKRPSTIMGRIAKGYSDSSIDAMSAHFGGMK